MWLEQSGERDTQPASDRFQLKWHLQEHGGKSGGRGRKTVGGIFLNFLSGELFAAVLVKNSLSHLIIYLRLFCS